MCCFLQTFLNRSLSSSRICPFHEEAPTFWIRSRFCDKSPSNSEWKNWRKRHVRPESGWELSSIVKPFKASSRNIHLTMICEERYISYGLHIDFTSEDLCYAYQEFYIVFYMYMFMYFHAVLRYPSGVHGSNDRTRRAFRWLVAGSLKCFFSCWLSTWKMRLILNLTLCWKNCKWSHRLTMRQTTRL